MIFSNRSGRTATSCSTLTRRCSRSCTTTRRSPSPPTPATTSGTTGRPPEASRPPETATNSKMNSSSKCRTPTPGGRFRHMSRFLADKFGMERDQVQGDPSGSIILSFKPRLESAAPRQSSLGESWRGRRAAAGAIQVRGAGAVLRQPVCGAAEVGPVGGVPAGHRARRQVRLPAREHLQAVGAQGKVLPGMMGDTCTVSHIS